MKTLRMSIGFVCLITLATICKSEPCNGQTSKDRLRLSLLPVSIKKTESPKEKALSIARADPRVKDILTDFPTIRLVPTFAEKYGVWIIEFMRDDREAGMTSVSLETEEVLEFHFQPKRLRETDDEIGNGEERDQEGSSFFGILFRFLPHFEGASLAWFCFLLTCILIGNFHRIISLRNVDILLLFSLCPFLNVIWQEPGIAYTGIFVVTVLFLIRCVAAIRIQNQLLEMENIGNTRILYFILILLALYHVYKTYASGVDDSGIWSVAGAQYLYETGRLPYGTEFGPNCVYGPLMYLIHIPANILFLPNIMMNPEKGMVELGVYEQIEMRGAQTVVILMDFLALLGMYLIGKKYGGIKTGMMLGLLYLLNPYILGMGGAFGLQQTSHITGIPFILFSFVFLSYPIATGLLLGIATGMLYYPVFLFPLWFGFYWKKHSGNAAGKFLVSYASVGIICLISICIMTVPDASHAGMSPLEAFVHDTIYQQQFSEGYGQSQFSFWGQYPSLRESYKSIVGIVYLLFCWMIALIPIRMNFQRFIVLTASVLVGTQLVLSHGGGTYIGFYIAPFLITLFGLRGFDSDPTGQPLVDTEQGFGTDRIEVM